MDWLKYLFSTDDFRPRGSCGFWTEPWISIYMISNLAIFIAYFAMPIIIICSRLFERPNIEDLTTKEIVIGRVTYALFILLCGIGHFVDGVLTFQYPAYRFLALFHLMTGMVSITAIFVTMHLRHKFVAAI